MSAAVDLVEQRIAEGQANATLIEWVPAAEGLFGPLAYLSPDAAISEAVGEFKSRGWTWDMDSRRLERNGWCAFFRSQGTLAPPIVQWGKIA